MKRKASKPNAKPQTLEQARAAAKSADEAARAAKEKARSAKSQLKAAKKAHKAAEKEVKASRKKARRARKTLKSVLAHTVAGKKPAGGGRGTPVRKAANAESASRRRSSSKTPTSRAPNTAAGVPKPPVSTDSAIVTPANRPRTPGDPTP